MERDLERVGDEVEERVAAALDARDAAERELRERGRVARRFKAEMAARDVQRALAQPVLEVEGAAEGAEDRLVDAHLEALLEVGGARREQRWCSIVLEQAGLRLGDT